jgi:excisionase family DNA binding protein
MEKKMQISLSIEEAQTATGIGRTKLYQAINTGALRARKYGKRTIILKDDLDAFLTGLAPYPAQKGE